MGFEAKIVADSIGPQGHRITSMLITFPRYILAEFNTHRMLSRNSASSRAIPFKKMVEIVKKNPFVPLKWMKDHTGMQGTEYFPDEGFTAKEGIGAKFFVDGWLRARDRALAIAGDLHDSNLTKQLCNRLLEPFMWHTCLVTATEWENFFALRYDPAADIHMQEIARLMLETMNASVPRKLKAGDWHIPFVDYDMGFAPFEGCTNEDYLKISTARCARTSYTLIGDAEKQFDYEADIKLHDRLAAAGHWSPFEHCAQAMDAAMYDSWGRRVVKDTGAPDNRGPNGFLQSSVYESGWCGNFRGWIQYRKLFANENRRDPRLICYQ